MVLTARTYMIASPDALHKSPPQWTLLGSFTRRLANSRLQVVDEPFFIASWTQFIARELDRHELVNACPNGSVEFVDKLIYSSANDRGMKTGALNVSRIRSVHRENWMIRIWLWIWIWIYLACGLYLPRVPSENDGSLFEFLAQLFLQLAQIRTHPCFDKFARVIDCV